MVSSDEINRRLESKRRGVKYQEPIRNKRSFRADGNSGNSSACPYCQTQNPPSAKFCVGCGRRLETPEPEIERGYTPEIREPQTAENTAERTQVSRRPDDFGGQGAQRIQSKTAEKMEPIVPPSPEPETVRSPEPPQVKRPETIPTHEAKKVDTKEKEEYDVDPVERIKKAKELLDLGAITQEEYDTIKSKYLNEL
ncbi:MAG: zinc-ribbon domain-containing protein [Methanothermobacter sp.]